MSSVPDPEQKDVAQEDPDDAAAAFRRLMASARMARPTRRSALASSSGRSWLRGFIGLLLAAGLIGAAFASQSSYGKLVIARWAPQLVPTSPQPQKTSEPVAQSSPPTAQAAAVEAVPPQPGPLAQTTPPDFAPAPAQVSPELARLLQTIAHDIANLDQGIEQFKASQEQVARDNTKAIEQLRASVEQLAHNNADATEQLKATQEQISRLLAKASEPQPLPKPSAAVSNRTARPPQAGTQPQPTRPQRQ